MKIFNNFTVGKAFINDECNHFIFILFNLIKNKKILNTDHMVIWNTVTMEKFLPKVWGDDGRLLVAIPACTSSMSANKQTQITSTTNLALIPSNSNQYK